MPIVSKMSVVSSAAAVLALAGGAIADVQTYLVQLQHNYEQTGPASVAALSYAFFSELTAQPGDVGLARVASPGTAGEETMIQVAPGIFQYGESFADEASLMDAYGPGFYTMSTSGGSTGFGFGDVPIYFPARFPSDAPRFDASTWTGLASVDAGADAVLTFNTFTTASPASRTEVRITREGAGDQVFFGQTTAAAGALTIPAGSLQPGQAYTITLRFVGDERMPAAGFVDADAYSRLVYETVADLTTAPGGPACPADLNGDGIVDFADYLEFLNRYDAGDLSVDFNDDGIVDFADYLEFLNLYDAGC